MQHNAEVQQQLIELSQFFILDAFVYVVGFSFALLWYVMVQCISLLHSSFISLA